MPLFILWFGFGTGSKVALVTVIVFFLVFYSTYEGVRDVEQRLLDVLKVMDASRLDLHLKVRLPSAATWIIQGLRVSVPYALVAAVTAEIVGVQHGHRLPHPTLGRPVLHAGRLRRDPRARRDLGRHQRAGDAAGAAAAALEAAAAQPLDDEIGPQAVWAPTTTRTATPHDHD